MSKYREVNQDVEYNQDKLPQLNNYFNQNQNNNQVAIANQEKMPEQVIDDYFINPIKTESHKENIPKIYSKNKPKWCLTKQEAEEMGEKEVDDLLNFAKNLDYERYIKNMEIREALYLIKNKVDGVQEEFGVEKNKAKEENPEMEDVVVPQQKEERAPSVAPQQETQVSHPPGKQAHHDKDWDNNVNLLCYKIIDKI